MFRFSLKRVSDEEYIEQLRRTMRLWTRVRPWVLAVSIATVVLGVAVGLGNAQFLWQLVQINAGLAFAAGILVGLGTVHGLLAGIQAIFSYSFDFQRTERLLLQYHDMFAELRSALRDDVAIRERVHERISDCD